MRKLMAAFARSCRRETDLLSVNDVSDNHYGQLRHERSQFFVRLRQLLDFLDESIYFRPDFGSIQIRLFLGAKTILYMTKFK
jgi:hypothetical protein